VLGRVTGYFAPSSVLPFAYSTFPAYFPAYSVKTKHHHLDVLTIFQRGARGVRGAVFRDTPETLLSASLNV